MGWDELKKEDRWKGEKRKEKSIKMEEGEEKLEMIKEREDYDNDWVMMIKNWRRETGGKGKEGKKSIKTRKDEKSLVMSKESW